jgi:hypothetical protein
MVFIWSPYVVATLPPLTRAPYVIAAVNNSTLRHCNTAAVYKSIWDSAHKLKTTTIAIIEALMA